MMLSTSSALVPRLIQIDSIASTNAELVRLASVAAATGISGELSAYTTVVTDDQTAGRGRRGREWVAPAGTSLAISVLLRPLDAQGEPLDAARFGWLPIAAGVAMTEALAAVLPNATLGFKWPNDVQVDGRKICGVLAELLPSGREVVMGAGVNLTMTADQLPVATATSAVLEGATGEDLADRVLCAYLRGLRESVESYGRAGGDADASGLRTAALARCSTIGRAVRAELPGGGELQGDAVGIDAIGRLQVRTGSGRVEAIAAGDVIHLR